MIRIPENTAMNAQAIGAISGFLAGVWEDMSGKDDRCGSLGESVKERLTWSGQVGTRRGA